MRLIIYIFLLCYSGILNAQSTEKLKLDQEFYNDLLHREFNKIVSPKTGNGVGNYASYEALESKLNFSGNIIMRDFQFMGDSIHAKGNILTINANGGFNENLISLFNNKKWNNNIGLELQYNILFKSDKNYVCFYDTDYESYTTGIIDRDKQVLEIPIKIQTRIDSNKVALIKERENVKLLHLKLKSDSILIESVKKEIITKKTITGDSLFVQMHMKLSKAKIELSDDSLLLLSAQRKVDLLIKDSIRLDSLQKNQANIQYKLLVTSNGTNAKSYNALPVTGFSMRWISVGYGINNNSFRLMDPSLSLNQEYKKSSFLTQEAKIQFNKYRKGIGHENQFFAIWMKGSITDNFNDLTKVDLEETIVDTSGTRTRKSTQSYSVYSGAYKKNIQQLTFGIEYYRFFSGGTVAVHIFPKWITTENVHPQANIGLGLVVPFKKKDKISEFINAELFIDATNIFRTNNEMESNLLKRSSYGIQFTAPLSF